VAAGGGRTDPVVTARGTTTLAVDRSHFDGAQYTGGTGSVVIVCCP
jgi:hypothetical protein